MYGTKTGRAPPLEPLHQQHARPEEVDLAQGLVQLLHMHLVAAHRTRLDAEDLEELHPEGLRIGLLVVGLGELLHEARGTGADLAAG